ncbi:MAG: hypothetical protein HY460_01970 [Parcubacteria group bacterium]|nr:hypothetical protein [Parcubacteria group bacterium]
MNTENETIEPEPTPDQTKLWGVLESRIPLEEERRDRAFLTLPSETCVYLASEPVSQKIRDLCSQYRINNARIPDIASLVKDAVIGSSTRIFLEQALKTIGVSPQLQHQFWDEVRQKIILPVKKDASSPVGPPAAPAAPPPAFSQARTHTTVVLPHDKNNPTQMNGNTINLRG